MSGPMCEAGIGAAFLAARDPILASVMKRVGACNLAPRKSGFPALAGMIVSQQLSRAAATTIKSRVASILGGAMTPAGILSVEEAILRGCGLSRGKISYLRGLAEATISGKLNFDDLAMAEEDTALEMLTSIRGVGHWTAEMYLIFALGRLDVLPLDDAALKSAFCELYNIPVERFTPNFISLSEIWRPYRSIACWYLYAHLNGEGAPLPGLGN